MARRAKSGVARALVLLLALVGSQHASVAQEPRTVDATLGSHRFLIPLAMTLPRFHDTFIREPRVSRNRLYLGFSLPSRAGLPANYDDALGASTQSMRAAVRAQGAIYVEVTLTASTARPPRDRSAIFDSNSSDIERLDTYAAAGLEGRKWKLPPLEGEDRDIDFFRPIGARDPFFDCRNRMKLIERTCGALASRTSDLQVTVEFLQPDIVHWKNIMDAVLGMVSAWEKN